MILKTAGLLLLLWLSYEGWASHIHSLFQTRFPTLLISQTLNTGQGIFDYVYILYYTVITTILTFLLVKNL